MNDFVLPWLKPADAPPTPIAWQVHWIVTRGWRSGMPKPKPMKQTFPDRVAAEREKSLLVDRWGSDAVVHLTPVFPTPATRDRQRKKLAAAALDALGWPVQVAPPRPGTLPKKGRRR